MKIHFKIILFIVLLIAVVARFNAGHITEAQGTLDLKDYRSVMFRMIDEVEELRNYTGADSTIFHTVAASGDPLYLAPFIDLIYFARGTDPNFVQEMGEALAQLSGQEFRSWREYFEWAGGMDIPLPPHYDEFKGEMFARLAGWYGPGDPEFLRFFQPGVMDTARINLVEVVWGGVPVDGIPSLVNAKQITPEEALREGEILQRYCSESCAYPAPDEFVFGVSINDDHRAYPLRILNWHEMFNDIIGHAPLYDAPGGQFLCNFRAPVLFQAVARQGDEWIQLYGEAAGCKSEGAWLAVAQVEWPDVEGGWETVRAQLPDVLASQTPLSADSGVTGRVVGKPVMLAYCTLCGSGILYDVTIPDLVMNGESHGKTVLEFGSSGLLMRSNKLMYDRLTNTVWNAMTGEPAFGPLATSDVKLEILPVVVTDWKSWLLEHPDTSVLSLVTGYERNYTNGAAYSDYFNSRELMFPVWQQDTSEQQNKEMVFALRLGDTPKAYPLAIILPEGVQYSLTPDVLAGVELIILAERAPERDFFEPGGAAVRAYESGSHRFELLQSGDLMDENGNIWMRTEEALVSPDGTMLKRLPGHLAFWFGWYGFYPDTLVYEP